MDLYNTLHSIPCIIILSHYRCHVLLTCPPAKLYQGYGIIRGGDCFAVYSQFLDFRHGKRSWLLHLQVVRRKWQWQLSQNRITSPDDFYTSWRRRNPNSGNCWGFVLWSFLYSQLLAAPIITHIFWNATTLFLPSSASQRKQQGGSVPLRSRLSPVRNPS